MNENRLILKTAHEAKFSGLLGALAVVLRVEGSSYRRAGAKMFVTEKGEIAGAVSGGCLERDLILRAQRAMTSGRHERIIYDTRFDGPEIPTESGAACVLRTSLGCEGIIEVGIVPEARDWLEAMERVLRTGVSERFVQRFDEDFIFEDFIGAPISLVVFGAGPDAVALTRLASELGWDTTVVDCRSSFPLAADRFAHVTRYLRCSPEEAVARSACHAASAVVAMTHNIDHDRRILRDALLSDVAYIGVLGPRKRGARFLSLDERERVHSPLGLDLGGDGPAAIALSALAEIQAVLNGRDAMPLKFRSGGIHAP